MLAFLLHQLELPSRCEYSTSKSVWTLDESSKCWRLTPQVCQLHLSACGEAIISAAAAVCLGNAGLGTGCGAWNFPMAWS